MRQPPITRLCPPIGKVLRQGCLVIATERDLAGVDFHSRYPGQGIATRLRDVISAIDHIFGLGFVHYPGIGRNPNLVFDVELVI